MKRANKLFNYSAEICSIDYDKKIAILNVRKYSNSTSKIQHDLEMILFYEDFTIIKYESTENWYRWNGGYCGADNWTKRKMKENGYI